MSHLDLARADYQLSGFLPGLSIILQLPNGVFKKVNQKNSLAVQWLRLCAFTDKGTGSVPVRELRSCKPCTMAKYIYIYIYIYI